MRRTAVLILLVMVSACAKARPALAPDRRTFTEVPAEPTEFAEKESEMDITIPAFNPLTGAGVADQIKARFRGTDRGTPKTTMVQASRKKFNDVASLAASLPSDDAMRNHTPALKRDSMFRVVEEQRNVQVPAWIYAMKYEADSDWHVILGTDPKAGAKTFFNAEVSGLPGNTTAAFATLQKVRTQLSQMLGAELPAGVKYRVYDHPVPVIVEGALFFDVDHAAGVVGPTQPTPMRPKTAWEIHPVTNLKLQ